MPRSILIAGAAAMFLSLPAMAGIIKTFDVPGSNYTVPVGITATGKIVGNYTEGHSALHPFVRAAGQDRVEAPS